MRWSERLWRLRECWRKLGALAGKGVGERLDYTCDLIVEAWVDDRPTVEPEELAQLRADLRRAALASLYFRGASGERQAEVDPEAARNSYSGTDPYRDRVRPEDLW